jgi:uncharacterized protein (DUF58 family)
MVREFTRDDDCRVLLVLDPHIKVPGAAPGKSSNGLTGAAAVAARAAARAAAVSPEELFERAVTLCASLAWHFSETAAALEFRTAGISTPLAAANENIFPILRHLAVAQPLPPDPEGKLITDLASAPELFKIIITSQSHGSIPASIWFSSYVIFLDDLQ